MPDEEPVEQVEEVEDEVQSDDEPTVDDDGLSEQDRREVTNLYKLLKDPRTQNATISALAAKAGLLHAETPKEVKEAKKDMKAIIAEALGPNYAFMQGPMERVFEEVLKNERSERAGELEHLTQGQVQQEVDGSLARLARETQGNSRKLEGKMIALMDQLHASPGISTYDYLKLLYQTANADRSAASARHQMADKINRNSKDAPGRLQSTNATTGKGQQPQGPEKKGIKAAVEYAMKQLEKD